MSSYTIAGKFIEFILQEVMIKLRVATFQLWGAWFIAI